MWLIGLLACGSAPVPVDTEPSSPPVKRLVRATLPESVGEVQVTSGNAPASAAAELYLEFAGLSPLHQGFFQDRSMTKELARRLSGCLKSPVLLGVSYDMETRVGVLELQVDRTQVRCAPVWAADHVSLAPWQEIGVALASYRDAVAGRYDLRLRSFDARLRVARAQDACTFELSGQYPPDGTTWSPCVRHAADEVSCSVLRGEGANQIPWDSDAARDLLHACLGS